MIPPPAIKSIWGGGRASAQVQLFKKNFKHETFIHDLLRLYFSPQSWTRL